MFTPSDMGGMALGGMGAGAGMGVGGFSGFDWRRMTDPNALWTLLEQSVRISLLSRVNTGSWYTDVMVALSLFYAVGLVLNVWSKLKPHFWKITRMEPWIWLFANIACKVLRGTRFAEKIAARFQQTDVLERTIPLVTSDKTINTLYDPMNALCSELLAKYRDEQRASGKTTDCVGELIVRESETDPSVLPTSGTAQEFRFQDVLFEYCRSSPLITIYGDRDRQRENHTIKLSCRVPRSSGTDPFKPLVEEAFRRAGERLRSNTWKQKLYRNNHENKWVESDPPGARRLETVVLRGNLRDEIVKDLDDFVANEAFYHDVGIPFARRYLFAGSPRTGKTSLVKALATAKKRHIHFLSLSTVSSDDELMNLLSPKNIDFRSTIVLIEDIDCASEAVLDRTLLDATRKLDGDDKRSKKNATSERKSAARRKGAVDWTHDASDAKTSSEDEKVTFKGITLAGLLNVLDGVVSADGQIMIATTNHPERLDHALVQPGRFHRRFDFELADREQFKRLYELFYKQPLSDAMLSRFREDVISPAEICNQFLGSFEDATCAAEKVIQASRNGIVANSFTAPVKRFSLLPSLPPPSSKLPTSSTTESTKTLPSQSDSTDTQWTQEIATATTSSFKVLPSGGLDPTGPIQFATFGQLSSSSVSDSEGWTKWTPTHTDDTQTITSTQLSTVEI